MKCALVLAQFYNFICIAFARRFLKNYTQNFGILLQHLESKKPTHKATFLKMIRNSQKKKIERMNAKKREREKVFAKSKLRNSNLSSFS